MGFKYIVLEVDRPEGVQRLPVIFPDVMVHRHVVAAISQLPNFKAKPARVVSAGDAMIVARCTGRSETLDLESAEGDTELVNTFPYWHGIIL